jgi:hypothetical protein
VSLKCNQNIADFANSETDNRAVLLYCSPSIILVLEMNDIAFTHVISGQVDHLLLRNLDQRASTSKFHLIVVTTPFPMRGIDYRAPKSGITLIIAKSFTNKREAL